MRTWLLALAAVAFAALSPGARAAVAGAASPAPPGGAEAATASDDPRVAAEALFARAESEDAAGDYGRAVADYRASVAKLPSLRYAPRAMTRAALLDAHSEGGWAPFARLESVRRDPKAANDPAAIDALSRDVDAFPPGPTRGEAWMVCADAYLSRLQRRADGEAALRKVVADPRTDPLLRRQAAGELVGALIDEGDLSGARSTARSLGGALDPKVALRVEVLARRRRVHFAAIADLALFLLVAAWTIASAGRRGALAEVRGALRRMAPLGAAFAAYVAVAGGALASGYESGNAAPFFVFGAVLLPLAAAARAWGAAGSDSRGARTARALLSASAVFAAAFLVLEALNGEYLEGFKL